MASKKILIPDMGDFKDVEIIEVLVKEGQQIKKNDSLITLESDKSSVEVPSSHEGVIEKINIKVGDKVNKGDLILSLNAESATEEKKEAVSNQKEIEKKNLNLSKLKKLKEDIKIASIELFENNVKRL